MKSAVACLIFFIVVLSKNNAQGQDYLDLMDDSGRRYSPRSVTRPPPVNKTVLYATGLQPARPQSSNLLLGPNDYSLSLGKNGHEVSCRGIAGEINAMGRQTMCRPRDSLVKLNPDPGFAYIPELVIVKRCEGMCGHHSQSCMPIESVTKKVQVKRLETGNWRSSPVCWELDVEEHTRCKCGCDVMPTDCNKRQKYNPDACKCMCNNAAEKVACDLKEDMEWNPESCRCMCRMEEEICNTGFVWVPSMCKCAQVMSDRF